MHKIIFFPEKNIIKKKMCLPYLKFSDLLSQTRLFGLMFCFHCMIVVLTIENSILCNQKHSFDLNQYVCNGSTVAQ